MELNLEEKYFVWLNSFVFLTPAKIKDFKEQFGNYENVFQKASEGNEFFKKHLDSDEFGKFCYCASDDFLKTLFKNLELQNVGILTKSNKEYAEIFGEKSPLAEIDILFYKGDLTLLKTKCLGVVGTRKPDNYGRKITEDFVKVLAKNGLTVVSGLASGVDSCAHRAALDVGGKTIAVLGGGFNHIYPTYNSALADEIAQKGLLLSEYAPQVLPSAFHFPIRNRIIAGISDGVLITQAGEKSGSMHTKNYAIDFGKDLFVVPADITREASLGTNAVIRALPHTVVFSPDEILQKFGIEISKNLNKAVQLSVEERLILDAIGSDEVHFSSILSKTQMDSKNLSRKLTIMKVSGIIKQLPGNFFSK